MPADYLPQNIDVKKYRRQWAVYVDSKLLAVVVYKKGAVAVKDLLETILAHVENSKKYRFADASDERPNRD